MAGGTTVQARVDKQTKERAKGILDALDITLSEAISMFLRQVIFHRGIPFDLKIPNEVTLETLEKLESGQDLREFKDADDLFEELNR
ncbi:MAG TPA: type II toxin-antitoxin system RelB/DinJ family antitoxin [Phycisphaerales bacterium]|nr:type II toxin-antitoxin system RelB/DinJ family antitoxin [Phycisphaerales bacterium]